MNIIARSRQGLPDRRPSLLTGCFLAVLLAAGPVLAQRIEVNEGRAEQLKQIFQSVAGAYDIRVRSPEDTPLALQREPIMHWLSLEGATGAYVGSVFVWTLQQRPAVVGTIFTSDASREALPACAEFYSYSFAPLEVQSAQGTSWNCAAGPPMLPLPDAPIPAGTEQARRLQLRGMSRQFSGRMNRRGVDHPLRLLPRPVYEYEGQDPHVLGGALFVLVAYATDPDILLLIEARQTEDGPRWFFQPARFSDKSLWLSYRDQNIWTSLRQGHGSDKPHEPDLQYHVEHSTLDAPPIQNDEKQSTQPQR